MPEDRLVPMNAPMFAFPDRRECIYYPNCRHSCGEEYSATEGWIRHEGL